MVIGTKDAIAAKRDKDLLKSHVKQLFCRAPQGAFIGDLDPGEKLRLQLIGLERMNVIEQPRELFGLCCGNGVRKERAAAIFREIAQRFGRKVCIDNAQACAVDKIDFCFQKFRRDLIIDVHVSNGQHHIAVLVCNEHICRGDAAGDCQRVGNIHADPAASLGKLCGMSVLAERRYKLDVLPEKGQVVCDIACNAPAERLT